LPIERPDFELLFGKNAYVTTPMAPLAEALKGFSPPQEAGCCDGGHDHAKVNGHVNGSANGHANGHANGSANGSANGHVNGSANGHTNGHANGHATGHANGHANGNGDPSANGSATTKLTSLLHEPATAQRTLRGGNDIDITDKLTMTWVCFVSPCFDG
jgi:hypothetical protein